MEFLECDRCHQVYTDQGSIQMAKDQRETWEEMCRRDGDEPRGIIACPIWACRGEMLLKNGIPVPATPGVVRIR